jgi:hypothetical protein
MKGEPVGRPRRNSCSSDPRPNILEFQGSERSMAVSESLTGSGSFVVRNSNNPSGENSCTDMVFKLGYQGSFQRRSTRGSSAAKYNSIWPPSESIAAELDLDKEHGVIQHSAQPISIIVKETGDLTAAPDESCPSRLFSTRKQVKVADPATSVADDSKGQGGWTVEYVGSSSSGQGSLSTKLVNGCDVPTRELAGDPQCSETHQERASSADRQAEITCTTLSVQMEEGAETLDNVSSHQDQSNATPREDQTASCKEASESSLKSITMPDYVTDRLLDDTSSQSSSQDAECGVDLSVQPTEHVEGPRNLPQEESPLERKVMGGNYICPGSDEDRFAASSDLDCVLIDMARPEAPEEYGNLGTVSSSDADYTLSL